MITTPVTRRELIKRGSLMVALGLTAPTFLASAAEATAAPSLTDPAGRTILVVLQLSGGNDGLNTVVPYADPLYYRARPRLAIPALNVLPISGALGLNPTLGPLKQWFDQKRLAVIQGVGYPNPDRSHFRSMEVWQTGVPDQPATTGWLGRYLDAQCCGNDPRAGQTPAVNASYDAPMAFWTEQTVVPSISSLEHFRIQTDPGRPDDREVRLSTLRALYGHTATGRSQFDAIAKIGQEAIGTSLHLERVAKSYTGHVAYPKTELGNALKTVSRIISADLGTRIFYVSTGGFDTHANQKYTHERLLSLVAQAVDAFMKDQTEQGRADRVALVTFSEFGRRVAENASNGTDHGAAAPMFALGGRVTGGIIGDHPNLADLDNGDLKHTIDFRQVYGTVLSKWLGVPAKTVLGGDFAPLGFI